LSSRTHLHDCEGIGLVKGESLKSHPAFVFRRK